MTPKDPLADAVSRYGAAVKAKLSNIGASGAPEDQLRAPLETLVRDLTVLAGYPAGAVVLVGESALEGLHTRPDYAATRQDALVGFIEVKAPGKGADPRRFSEKHDRDQWEKLRSLPNLVYTDGASFSLWRDGEAVGSVVRLEGDLERAGASLAASASLTALFADFFSWEPIPPRTARDLAGVSARLCRLLRDEVTEQLGRKSDALTSLAEDWRRLLFPHASDTEFADGYAQAVTFGLLMARAQGIALADGLDRAGVALRRTNSLIGTALRLFTDEAVSQATLKTSLATLVRVLDAVHWERIGKDGPDAWLYFYEEFLSAYDNDLRKQTGSYYTPPEVVTAMVRLVDEALRAPERFDRAEGLAATDVTVADPAAGTGTFLLGILRRIATTTAADLGEGAVAGVIRAALGRLIGFEMQFGPFAVAQLRLVAEVLDLTRPAAGRKGGGTEGDSTTLRLYLTNTLGNPDEEQEHIPMILRPLGDSRRAANAIKRQEPITVVIGNPPYRERARGRGGWIEAGSANMAAPLRDWMPPAAWGVGAHLKHLRNLYVYFWRWAAWKVFEDAAGRFGRAAEHREGIVSFITVAGFLNGPGFQKMRADLRRDTSEIWVIDGSPEGHQPEVASRIFQGVQQPVCIVMACRFPGCNPDTPARVRYRALPPGRREAKFQALDAVTLDGTGWTDCPAEWRAPFLPAAAGAWADFPALTDLFLYNGSGVMPGRTWVIAPDAQSLRDRWDRLVSETDPARKERLFHPHLQGDRTLKKVLKQGLPGRENRAISVGNDNGACAKPERYAFRSFDRQWIIPDARLINRPNPKLWAHHSKKQVYLTGLFQHSPTSGPAVTFSGLIPDLHHYKGSFGGRAFPLWSDREATRSNLQPNLLAFLSDQYGREVGGEDAMAYLAAVAAHPAYTARFAADLVQPGLRIPLTADAGLFFEAADTGREAIWLHTFGERFVDRDAGRPGRAPRSARKTITNPRGGTIPEDADAMPDSLVYDAAAQRLHVGAGYIDGVRPAVWRYEVSGTQVLEHWFSYRRRDRSRPIIGERREPSPLGEIQPSGWLAEYTTELLNLIHVLDRLVDLEPVQAALLERICTGPLITDGALRAAGAFVPPRDYLAGIDPVDADDRQFSLQGLFDQDP